MRNLCVVISQICSLINKSSPQYLCDLRSQLKIIERESLYCAPEATIDKWLRANNCINMFIDKPLKNLSEIEKNIIHIWTGAA